MDYVLHRCGKKRGVFSPIATSVTTGAQGLIELILHDPPLFHAVFFHLGHSTKDKHSPRCAPVLKQAYWKKLAQLPMAVDQVLNEP